MSITNNHASLHLWRKKMVEYQNLSKYYVHHILQKFVLHFMPLVTVLIVKSREFLGGIYFIF